MNTMDLMSLSRRAPVHFMGVGGAGMCALAELILRSGGMVSGCDAKESPVLDDLRALGADIRVGHAASHVDGASALVVTAAVDPAHEEVARARDRGIPVVKRARALGAWVNRGRLVAVAGTHGKTTTTAMTTEILTEAGLDPTGLVGGRVAEWGGNLRFGSDDVFVVEADEYDRSFHALTPDVAVVTNVEADHLEIYGDAEGVREGFRTFLRGLRTPGRAIVCADDPGASSLVGDLGAAAYTYGLSAGCRLRAVDVTVSAAGTKCVVMEEGVRLGSLGLRVSGAHNLRNALAAAAVGRYLDAPWDAVARALADFRGVGRRFERLGEVGG
ncbi:MAG: Mur ligase family protein, partial [Gemmatimonadota bacterium]|nr:Mur ligase family protein [Gemmatimonadota bacterium]